MEGYMTRRAIVHGLALIILVVLPPLADAAGEPFLTTVASRILIYAIAAVSLIGLPPSAGFIGKWLLLEAGLTSEAWIWLGILILITALSAAYLWRVVSRGLQSAASQAVTERRWHTGDAIATGLAASAMVLGLGAAGPLGLLETGNLAISAIGAS